MDERRAEKIVQLLEQYNRLGAEMERLQPESDLLVEVFIGVRMTGKLWLDRQMLYMLLKHQRIEVSTKLIDLGVGMKDDEPEEPVTD